VVEDDGFDEWRNAEDDDQIPGKMTALIQSRQFFEWLDEVDEMAQEVQRPAEPLAIAEPTMAAARSEASSGPNREREINSVAQTRNEVEPEVRAEVWALMKAETEARLLALQTKHEEREHEMLAREHDLLCQIATLASELEQQRAKAQAQEKDAEVEDDCSFMVGSVLCGGSSQSSTSTLSSGGTPSCVAAGVAATELDQDDASTISSFSASRALAPVKSSGQTRKKITFGRDTFQAAKLRKGERFVGEVVKLLKKGKGRQAAFVRFGNQAGRCEKDGRVFGSELKLGAWIDVAVHDVQISRSGSGAVQSRIDLKWV